MRLANNLEARGKLLMKFDSKKCDREVGVPENSAAPVKFPDVSGGRREAALPCSFQFEVACHDVTCFAFDFLLGGRHLWRESCKVWMVR